MKNAIIILVLLFFCSCTTDTTSLNGSSHTEKVIKRTDDSTRFICKEKLDSLGLMAAYDSCKFWLYCYNIDDTIYFKNKYPRMDSFTLFPCLNLDCGSINVLNDTVEFLFHITLKDSLAIDWGRTVTSHGVLYKLSEKKLIGYIFSEPLHYIWTSSPRSRANNPLQPPFLNYIQTNYFLFNPWFVARLKERKIVK